MEFAYDGGGMEQGQHRHLYCDWHRSRHRSRRAGQPVVFSADETTADIGRETGTTGISRLRPHEQNSTAHR